MPPDSFGPALLGSAEERAAVTVLGCSGHQDIPAVAAHFVEHGLSRTVGGHERDGLVGVCSLAKGADQLFARLVLDRGGSLHVVIPSASYESTFDDRDRAEFAELVAAAAQVETLDFSEPTEAAFLAAGLRVVEFCDVLIAVWDGKPAKGKGGTADVVDHARQIGRPVEIIWPEGVSRA